MTNRRKKIVESLLPWTILAPIALVLGIILEPILHRLVYGNPAEKAMAMVVTTIIVTVAALALKLLGERLARTRSRN